MYDENQMNAGGSGGHFHGQYQGQVGQRSGHQTGHQTGHHTEHQSGDLDQFHGHLPNEFFDRTATG